MGLIAARKSLQLVDNVHTIVSVLVAACYQAASLSGFESFSPGVRGLLTYLGSRTPAYRDEQGLASDYLARIRESLLQDDLEAMLPRLSLEN
jgi:histidine ammonia-lyase